MHGHFLAELLLVVAVATAGAALFERARLPAVVGFLVTGAVVGPGGLAWVADAERVRALAELGVVFLLFEIGLELPIERVRRLWRRAAAAGGLQVGLTLPIAAAMAFGLGRPVAEALVMGGLVAMSSTALVMRLLSDRGEIDSPQGQLCVGILIFQDLCIVPLLLGVPLLAGLGGTFLDAALGVGRSVVALVGLFVAARFALPRLLASAAASGSRDAFTLLAFLVVLGSAWIAEEVGLTLAVGAFVGGLVLSASPYSHQLFAEVLPLRGVLLGIFFTAVGMLLEPAAAWERAPEVGVYVASVVLLKAAVVVAIVAGPLRQGLRLGLLTGMALAQTGEFSFVLAEAASEADLLSPEMQQVFVAGSMVTLLATPFMVRAAPLLSQRLPDPGGEPRPDEEEPAFRDHVVLLGFGLAGQTLARVLRARGIPYLGVDANPVNVQELHERGEPVVYGDVTRRALLHRLCVEHARLAVVTVSDPVATPESVKAVRELAPDLPVVVRTRFVLEVDAIYAAGATAVVAEELESTLEVMSRALGELGYAQSAVMRFAAELREEGYEPLRSPALALDPWLGEVLEEASSQWVEVADDPGAGATVGGLAIRARTGCSVVAVEHQGERIVNPSPDQPVVRGDRLLALGEPRQVEQLRAWLAERGAQASRAAAE